MIAGQKMYDRKGRQVALFPMEGFHISQTDYGTTSHGGGFVYWATDYLGWGDSGRILRCPCYAPVDIKLIFKNQPNAMAVWESLEKVHLANGKIDYLTLTCYHDNDIEDGNYYPLGTVKLQGEEFFKTGTGGNVTGDHLHLETGYGKYQGSTSPSSGNPEYKFHITDYTNPKRLHNYNALYINDTNPIETPLAYNWITYKGGSPYQVNLTNSKFPWVLYSTKLRNKR